MKRIKTKEAIEFDWNHVEGNDNNKLIPPGRYFSLIPNTEDKVKILEFDPDANFQDFYYLLTNVIYNVKGNKVVFKKQFNFLKIRKYWVAKVMLDENNMVILGTNKRPYRLYTPEGDYFKNPENIIKYVAYHFDGEPIKDSLEFILKEIPDGSSDYSVLLIFQWQHENPSRSGYYVVPKKITLGNLIEKFNSL